MPRRLQLPVLGALLLTLAGCTQNRVPIGVVKLRQERSTPIDRLTVSLDRGQVAVAHSESGALEVEAEVRVVEDRAAEFLGEELRFDDHVAMTEDGTSRLMFRSAHEGDPDGDDWELRITVRVPGDPQVRLKIDAGSASVRLHAARGVSADLDAGQVDVDVDRVEGEIALNVDAGQIRVAARERVGDVDLSVKAGQIDVLLPDAFAGTIDASTDVGEVDLAARFGLTPQRDVTSQSVRGVVGQAGERRVVLRVDAGQIKVR